MKRRSTEELREIAARYSDLSVFRKEQPAVYSCIRKHNLASSLCKHMKRSHRSICVSSLQKLAKERRGELLTSYYLGYGVKHIWRCHFGHEWTATPRDVLFGTWCPSCKAGVSERLCRAAMESYFGVSFPRARPQFLERLEYDGYNPQLNIAFEHDGAQHFSARWLGHNHFLDVQKRDCKKNNLSRKNGILLVRFHDLSRKKRKEQYLKKTIDAHLASSKLESLLSPGKKLDLRSAYLGERPQHELELLASLVESRGGKIIDSFYVNALTPIKVICEQGHQWDPLPSHLKRGSWCPHCSGNLPLKINEIRSRVTHLGFRVSGQYENNQSLLSVSCSQGHKWRSTWASLAQRNSCMECEGKTRDRTISDLEVFAHRRGGKCLSAKYTTKESKYLWRCSKGHEWEATAGSVINSNTWCPSCARNQSFTIGDAVKHARKHKGLCLSDAYINCDTPLQWQCRRGHTFQRSFFGARKAKNYCPVCWRSK